jgi:4-amino-4-deoxy-L-arabinose transferase-like glycosyltransferase
MTRNEWWQGPVAAALAFLFVCVAMLALRPVLPIDETRYLTVAWEMWQGGSKIVPHINGETYSHKPPLLFWLINLVWAVAGPSEFAARLVGPAAGVAVILMTARLARLLWPEAPEREGRAAWIVATGGTFLAFGSTTMFDALLSVAVVGAMLALWSMARQPGWRAAVGLGLALAFGVLAKGPVILVHVLPVALTFPLWQPLDSKARRRDMATGVGLGLLVALALVALWLVPALVFGDPQYRNDILWRQSAGRMVASFAHDRPIWFFVALLPMYLFPWGWGREVAGLWPKDKGSAERFLLVWALGAFAAFSLISGKQIHYLIPELPALALLLSRGTGAAPGRWTRFIPMLPAIVILGLGAAAALGQGPAILSGGVGPLELAVATVIVATALVLVASARSRQAARIPVAPATLVALFLIAFQTIWATNNPGRLAGLLSVYDAQGIATLDQGYVGQFSFSARLATPVTVLREPGALETWMAEHPGGLLLTRAPITLPGLQFLREDTLHGDQWFVYSVEP